MPKILYEGQEYPVGEDEVKNGEDAIAFLTPFSPRVAGGEVEVDVKDGETIYRVTARAQGKGHPLQAVMEALDKAPEFVQPAIRMAEEMERMSSTQMLLERDRIREAYEAGKAEYNQMVSIQRALAETEPIPGNAVPVGF
jgi:hypothetical protein